MTLRYAFRSLARSPGFVVIAVLALGVGLGLSTTMFAVMDAVIHPYVGYKHPETLFTVNWWFGRLNPMSGPELYRYLRDNTHAFSDVMPEERLFQIPVQAGDGGEFQVMATRVPARFFRVTGMGVDRGRAFVESDGDNVAIVGPGLWRRLYGRRKDLHGATLNTGRAVYAIVGVVPESACDGCAWLPSTPGVETSGTTSGYLRPLVRLRPGVSRDQAAAELKRLAALLTDRFDAKRQPFAFDLTPAVDKPEEMRDIQKAMVGAALIVLLIACVNLAHLMLARGLAKRHELALRMAVGASRGAVVRQIFTECAIVTAAGAALGVAIAIWGTDVLRYQMPREVSWIGLVRPQLSWRVFALSTSAAVLSAILFGLLPAIRVTMDVNVAEPLKDDGGTTTGRVSHRYSPLVVSEVALALVLLMGGGLLVRTVAELQRNQVNFETSTLLQGMAFTTTTEPTAGGGRRDVRPVRREDVMTVARGVPGVRDVAFLAGRAIPGNAITAELADSTRLIIQRAYASVTANVIKVFGLPILRGRNFEPGDEAGSGVAIIDPIAAQILYPHQDPVGRMLGLGAPGAAHTRWVPIVGIVRSPSVLRSREQDTPQPTVYICERDTSATFSFVARTTRDDPKIAATFQSRLQTAAGLSSWIYPYDYWRAADLRSRAFLAKVFVGMGVVALALAALGLFGVLSYAVNRRRREFAVRLALGAAPRQLLNMVFHDGAVMLLAGTGIGAFAALAAARYLDAVLVSVLPSDVIALVLAEAVLLSVGFLAATAPARRAAKANPLDIIRAV